MDERTAQFYRTHAADVAARYESVVSPVGRLFQTAFVAGSRVLDIGAGSGRDLAQLLTQGFDAFGVEPVDELRVAATASHPELAGRIVGGQLPGIGTPHGGRFDGVLCSAVLMHVPESDLFDAAFELRGLLRHRGRLLISLPSARKDIDDQERDAHGRLFRSYTADHIALLFERIGFQEIGRWENEDALGRAGTQWVTLLLELHSGGPLRAVDQIEGILNRDKKVATYKLALFRALAELAIQEPRGVRWNADGSVGVPIERIAERWLFYYWPIFAADRFTPQSQAEGAGNVNPVAFRAALLDLIALYAGQGEHGGLSTWQLQWASGRLPSEASRRLVLALREITGAIRNGPVKFAGGALETGTVFRYDVGTKCVTMSADLWRELTLLGHWILDSVIVRWAALTERFSARQGIHSGDVLPLLLAKPEPKRAVEIARSVFLKAEVDRCTWSDRALQQQFAVDHVIPFSLWGSNDLWNLLPVDARINGQKADKLPSTRLLLARKPIVLKRWQLLRDAMPEAFDLQARRLLGRSLGGPLAWTDDLFTRLREAIEITALQRGIERWEPRA